MKIWGFPGDPEGGDDVANFLSTLRFYEQKTRAIMTAPCMGKMKDDDLIGIEPHDRIYPTGFYQPKVDFKGTLLSCLGFVYCDDADKAKPYNEWRGTLHTTVENNTKRCISEICAGYYAKLNTNSKPMEEKASWAVLCAFRPWASPFGEPQVSVMEMKEGKMINDGPVKNINADQIVAVGGLTNSPCVAVTAWLTANMPCFKSIRTSEMLAKGATPRSEADVGRAIEESLGVLNQTQLRRRYVANMRAYADELMTNERCLLGIREGNVQWTKVVKGQENEVMTTKINKETTAFDKWWIRQLLRGVEAICVVTEFGPITEFLNTMVLYQLLMADHEEEILLHFKTLDYGNADVAKAHTLPSSIHALDAEDKIQKPVYVPGMFAGVLVAMVTQTTADDKTAKLKDATAWVPKQMRLNFKRIQKYMSQYETPEWVTEVKAKRAKEASDLADLDEEAKAAAFRRIGMRGTGKPAPGDPGGLAASKPIAQAKAKKFDPKKRGLDQLPIKHLDDPANFDDGKTKKTRLVGTWARFATGSEGRTKKQLNRWCVCDQSKDPANKERAFYPGHFASTQGSNNSAAHPNQGQGWLFVQKVHAGPGQGWARQRQRQGETRRERRHVERQPDRRRRGPQPRHCLHLEPPEPDPHAHRSARR